MSKETIDAYRANGRRCGPAPADGIHAESRPHMSVHVWLVHDNAAWFRRPPGGQLLEPCACGHVAAYEQPLDAALRHYAAMTGSPIDENALVLAGLVPMPRTNPDSTLDDEFTWIYVHAPADLPVAGGDAGGNFVPMSLDAYWDAAAAADNNGTGDADRRAAFSQPDPLEFGLVRRALERIWAGWTDR